MTDDSYPTDDDSYPPEWDDSPPPNESDPRYGGVLRTVKPTAAERALVAELTHQYVSRNLGFADLWAHFCTDRYGDNRWPNVFLALLEQFAATAVGVQGEGRAIARCADEAQEAQKSAAEFPTS